MKQEKLQERAGFYRLLRALYSYPISEDLLRTILDLKPLPNIETGDGLRKIQSGLAGDLAEKVEVLNTEMTRLLEGPGITPAPPYASYFLNQGQLMGNSALIARQFYQEWRVEPDLYFNMPDDHITLEMGFLAHLAQIALEKDSEDREQSLEASRDFLKKSLMPWLSQFCRAVIKASSLPFFVGLAEFTHAYVHSDFDWLSFVLMDKNLL